MIEFHKVRAPIQALQEQGLNKNSFMGVRRGAVEIRIFAKLGLFFTKSINI